ncbi:sirohydrochlorin chelatase [Pseudonocardia abyssalis]|uniref:Sirohydrochlorin chelatase n=1 Tax=Pseudonocardia abyssalis TaxID=2792008 RepID=A0ABS6UTG7_9PSEU|nr:sirohydrochlorin chelatase [Pseudonocardia abyssalis]MBW0116817.1 sirohydrochlorin chelatase [Pseudonocardia abyssalis]MBW0135522.1 sirohydrochlorin chelatase [Pseudonocardia abyssalis]
MEAALVAVAHGSRDPRSAAAVAALMDEVRRRRPDLDVRLSFLDLSAPRLPDVLAAVDGVHDRAVVVPLLLGHAFHARVDVPGAVAEAARRHPGLAIGTAEVLGGDPRLEDAALDRLAAVAGRLDDPDLGVVVAAIGSSHAPANDAVHRIAQRWAARFGWAAARAAFATATTPTVPDAIRSVRAAGARRVAVAPWILAPGLLPDRMARDALATDPTAVVAGPLADHPSVAAVVADRWAAAAVPAERGRLVG